MKQKPTTRTETRRQEARRQLQALRGSLWQRVSRQVSPLSLLIWVAFCACTITALLAGDDRMVWQKNALLSNDIAARVSFEVEDTARIRQERMAAAISAPAVFIQNPAPLAALRNQLNEVLALAKASTDDAALLAQLTEKGWQFDESALAAIRDYAGDEARTAEYARLVDRVIQRLGAQYIVAKPANPIREGTPPTTILRRSDPAEGPDIEILTSRLRYVADAKIIEQASVEVTTETLPQPLRQPVTHKIVALITGDPNRPAPLWRYDKEATAEAIRKAQDGIPRYTFRYERGDPIVRAGTELGVEEIELLRKEHEEYIRQAKTDPSLKRRELLAHLGMSVMVVMIVIGLATYTAVYQERIFHKPARTFALAVLLLAVVLCSRLAVRVPEFTTGLIVLAALLLTIAYNQRFAFGAAGVLAIMATLAVGGDFSLFLTFMVALSISIFALGEIRSRSKVVGVGALSAIGIVIASAATNLYEGQEWRYVSEHAVAAAGTALFAGFIVQGILPHFERFFGIATSMTLLEWCDASRPLLRRLAQEAPGTYAHSLVLAQMSESAAEAIGANGLLARVGALYHDIGKTQKSAYFVENQEARMNRHDRLSPTMSLLVITGHVKDGLEMAKAYGLPRVLHQFILEHHGTTVVKYFHHAANEAVKAAGRNEREIPESEFRYPGPKPRTRESAILMLCDGCEGAVRALDEPTAGRIETTVHQIVMARLNDGQFDECEITLRELHQVEESIVKSLCAIHHGRIKYPKAAKPADKASTEKAATDKTVEPPSAPERARERTPEVAQQP